MSVRGASDVKRRAMDAGRDVGEGQDREWREELLGTWGGGRGGGGIFWLGLLHKK
jgi:hypothetical protein